MDRLELINTLYSLLDTLQSPEQSHAARVNLVAAELTKWIRGLHAEELADRVKP